MTPAERLSLLLRSLEDNGHTVPCRGDARERWTSEDRTDRATAAQLCQTACPALGACTDYADDVTPSFGVWAGRDHGHRTPATKPSRDAS